MTTLTCLTCEHVFSIGQKWYCHACHEAALAKVARLEAEVAEWEQKEKKRLADDAKDIGMVMGLSAAAQRANRRGE